MHPVGILGVETPTIIAHKTVSLSVRLSRLNENQNEGRMAEQIVTIPVIIRRSGKVEGIPGLYKDPRTGRLYVRFSFHGIDKQRSITVKKETFSELKAEANKALTSIRREVKEIAEASQTSDTTRKDPAEFYRKRLAEEIFKVLSGRGCTKRHIKEVQTACTELCLCQSKNRRDIEKIDAYNEACLREMMEKKELPEGQKAKRHGEISSIFARLIAAGIHTGANPTRNIAAPRVVTGHRKVSLNFVEAAKVVHELEKSNWPSVKKMEIVLFFRMCVETGQRPNDIMFFNPTKIEQDGEHYSFFSTKTRREQRVMHLLSPSVRDLITKIILARGGMAFNPSDPTKFWSYSLRHFCGILNEMIKKAAGEDKILYATRHFFITEIFRRTESTFWAEAFTHEGRTVAQCHYLHPDQSRADEILKQFCADFQAEINKQAQGK